MKRNMTMKQVNNLSARLFAAVTSIAISAVFLAVAIAPASQTVVTSGVFA